jgi:hypothetical protein
MCIATRLLAAVLAAIAAIPVLVDVDRNGNIWVFERCGSTGD